MAQGIINELGVQDLTTDLLPDYSVGTLARTLDQTEFGGLPEWTTKVRTLTGKRAPKGGRREMTLRCIKHVTDKYSA